MPQSATKTVHCSTISCPEIAEGSDLFPIFAKSWFAFSLAARHNVGNNSPSQAHHNSTVKRHLTPIKHFQNTQKSTYVKWSTITRTTPDAGPHGRGAYARLPHLEPAQAQRVAEHADRADSHGASGEHGIEEPVLSQEVAQ